LNHRTALKFPDTENNHFDPIPTAAADTVDIDDDRREGIISRSKLKICRSGENPW
jgi:hypothetical protein